MSVANSIQEPLKGMIRAEYKLRTIWHVYFVQRIHPVNGAIVKPQHAPHHLSRKYPFPSYTESGPDIRPVSLYRNPRDQGLYNTVLTSLLKAHYRLTREQYIRQSYSEADLYSNLELQHKIVTRICYRKFSAIPYTIPPFSSFQEVCQVEESLGMTSIVLRESPDMGTDFDRSKINSLVFSC